MNKKEPLYQLNDVCLKAGKGSIAWRGQSESDARSLGYTDEEVSRCLCLLSTDDFCRTVSYPLTIRNGTVIVNYDEYLTTYETTFGKIDDLYMKFKLSGWVLIASFHLQRH